MSFAPRNARLAWRRALTWAGLLAAAAPLAAQSFTLRLDDWAQMPASGDLTLTGASLSSNPNYVTRINFLREEPGGTGRMWLCDLNGSIYIFDKGGNVTTRTAQLLAQAQANEATAAGGVYLDFNRSNLGVTNTAERLNVPNHPAGLVTGTHRAAANNGLFVHFTKQAGYANGLVCFQFDPDYTHNGKFYTVHVEMANASTGNATTGNRTSGSPLLTGINTANKVVGQLVSGPGIPAGAWIATLGTSNLTLSAPATSSGNGTYTFADPHKPNNSKFPNFDTSGYSISPVQSGGAGGATRQAVLIEWTDTDITNTTFEGTARELLRIAHTTQIHPLGDIVFNPLATHPGDPDYGVMYIAIGEGGSGESNGNDDGVAGVTAGDRHFNTQRLDTLQGKIIRLIPDLAATANSTVSPNGRYRIPQDNPFVALADANPAAGIRKEIWTYGHRNPHRLSWDPVSNQLIVCEIGLHEWEEINIVEPGKNYGYGDREGPQQLIISSNATLNQTLTAPPTPDTLPLRLNANTTHGTVAPTYPAAAYPHDAPHGDAIASGFVYRGAALPGLQGKFVFGDITTGRLWYCDLDELLANHQDANPATLATLHSIEIQWDNPYDGAGVQTYSRLFEIVTAAYHARGGTDGDLPGGATISGTGRADIRFAVDAQGELFIISKSDGMIRAVTPIPAPVITTHPGNQTASLGGTASFVLGLPTPPAPFQVHWQGAPAGGSTFTDLTEGGAYANVTTANLTVRNITAAMHGDRFRAVVANDGGATTSNPATLTVLVPDPMAVWRQGVFTPEQLANPAVSGDTADPDHDGLANLLEYAFGLSPLNAASAQWPQPQAANGGATLAFAAVRGDLIYTVQASPDLEVWSTAGVTTQVNGGQITATVPLPPGARVFLRIVVTKPGEAPAVP